MMMSTSSIRSLLSNLSVESDADARRIDPSSPVWNGFLDEFRNQLTALMATSRELGAEAPQASEVGDAVFEAERKVRGLTSLVALVDASVDASVRTIEPIIAPLGVIVDRAVRLAGPSAGPRTSIVVSVPRAAGVLNRGAAFEGMLAALIVDLARSHAGARVDVDVDAGRPPLVRVEGDAGRRGLAIEVSCDGARPDSSSWRFVLATELAAELGASLAISVESSAYVVQFAFMSS
jgi:hypothetical protein